MDTDLKWVITEEERTRHDALFYSQNPKKGYLSGEQARSLFIRSRLPLSELSKIWKLADISRDNLLDISEFATAMHLIQMRLKGFDIPEKLPTPLTPVRAVLTDIPPITSEEWNAYNKTFDWKDANNTGFMDTETACGIMLMSNLESSILSKIWNLSDIDRDCKLSLQEFAIAFHLLRYYKKGNVVEGSIDVKAMLPIEGLKDDTEAKRKRHNEVQSERRQLLLLKQKLCSELARGLDDADINEKIRPELNKVEDRLYNLEKEETELRRCLLNLKDRSKKENFKPFDKSFLLKKRVSGEDLFKGQEKKSSIHKDSALFERLWTSNGANLENTVPSKENNNREATQEISLNNNYSETQPNDITFTEITRSSGTENSSDAPKILNGVTDPEDNKTRSNHNSNPISDSRENSSRLYSTESLKEPSSTKSSSQGGQKKEENLDDSLSLTPDTKRKVVEEKVEEIRLAKPRKVVERDESFSWARIERRPIVQKRVQEEVLEIPKKQDKETRETGNSKMDNKYKGKKPVQEEVSVDSVDKVESAADQNIDKMFKQMSFDLENGTVNGLDHGSSVPGKSENYKLPVGRVLTIEEEKQMIDSGSLKKAERQVPSRTQPTQEELLPIYLEERRSVEEERRKKREIEEEKRRKAREELKKQEEERSRELMERKGAMLEAKGKIERRISQSDKDVYKSSDAGYLIEQELEEQRRREEETQKTMEEVRKNELIHPKGKDQKVHAKQVYIDTGKIADKPVIRRPKTEPKHQSNRKSWVELEIEEQKRKDEEMRREIEQRQSDLHRLKSDQKPLKAVKREIEITESSIKSTTSRNTVESQPATKGTAYNDASRPVTNAKRPANEPDKKVVGSRVQGNVRSENTPRDVVDGRMTAEERRIREEEEKKRIKQIETIRQESQKREAEELMRLKAKRDEELRKKREVALREAEKRKREEEERIAESQKIAESRRLRFHAEKVRLEERVINTMKESQLNSEVVLRNKNSSPSNEIEQDSPRSDSQSSTEDTENRERRKSVRDTKALFEKSAPNQEQEKVIMRKKRQSLDLEDSANQQKPSRKDRVSFYSDGISTHEFHSQVTKEREVRPIESDEKPTRLNLGSLSEKRQQFEGQRQQNSVERRQPAAKEEVPAKDKPAPPSQAKSAPPPLDQVDGVQPMTKSFFPPISNNRIQQEMEELRQREQEIHARRQAMVKIPSDRESLDAVKKNPLPNKMQVQKGSSTTSEVVVRKREPEQKSAPKKQKVNRKSFIELEKEKEREREEELQREREAIMREKEEMQKKKENELEAKQEKDQNKNKGNAMSLRWQK